MAPHTLIGLLNGGNGYYPSIPVPENPAIDTTGEDCGVGQSGSVWFLAGTTGGKNYANTYCSLRSGHSDSPLNSECSTAEFPDLTTEVELRECAKNFQDQLQQMEFVLDGTRFEGIPYHLE